MHTYTHSLIHTHTHTHTLILTHTHTHTHHVALEANEVHSYLGGSGVHGVITFDEVQQVCEELVATLQDTKGN